jgi:hypothetical protein
MLVLTSVQFPPVIVSVGNLIKQYICLVVFKKNLIRNNKGRGVAQGGRSVAQRGRGVMQG